MLHIERGQHVEPYGESTRPSQPEREREIFTPARQRISRQFYP